MKLVRSTVLLVLLSPFVVDALAAGPGGSKPRLATRDDIRACMNANDHLSARRQVLNHNMALSRTRQADTQTRAVALIEAQRNLDRNDEQQVEAFNARVAEHNKLVQAGNALAQEINAMEEKFSADALDYNTTCATQSYKLSDREAVLKERKAAAQ